ncbi:hypothetical protein [Streptomyces sp. NPDC090083]|uniref:hypothetical protein n=1 Tax=Streptomyces sp. NPDC090083 TaxID=3365941 RepID=UPI00382F0EFC
MATDTGWTAACDGSATSGTSLPEDGAEPERTSDRLEALQRSLRTWRRSPRVELWRHDLRETRETWFRLVDPDSRDLTLKGH